jgi:transposase
MPTYRAPYPPLPSDTERAGKTSFNPGHLYLTIGDELDALCEDVSWESIDSGSGMQTHTLFVITMLTIFQFAEDIPDRQAADEVRTRMDWKYALHLPIDYPGVDPARLSEFRRRLLQYPEGQRVFECMLARLAKVGLLGGQEKRRSDAAQVLTSVERLSLIERVARAMRIAVETLAAYQPEWLRRIGLPHWYERYGGQRVARPLPTGQAEQDAWLRATEADITYLLAAIEQPEGVPLASLMEIQALRQIRDQELGSPQNDRAAAQREA